MKLPSKKILLAATGSALLLGYAGGFLSQILNGYAVWRESGGIPGFNGALVMVRPTNKHGSRHGQAKAEQGKARVVIQKGKK